MTHIKMMQAVQIRKAVESGEDVGEIANRYKISVDQVLGYAPAEVGDTRSPQQKAADTRKANAAAADAAEVSDDFAS